MRRRIIEPDAIVSEGRSHEPLHTHTEPSEAVLASLTFALHASYVGRVKKEAMRFFALFTLCFKSGGLGSDFRIALL
jgi:hypothetical protein